MGGILGASRRIKARATNRRCSAYGAISSRPGYDPAVDREKCHEAGKALGCGLTQAIFYSRNNGRLADSFPATGCRAPFGPF